LHIFNVFAYLDPSYGSVVFQSLIGIVAGIGVFGRKLFSGLGHKVKGIFSRSTSGKSQEE
jgi:hypothetical protein